MRLTCLTRSAIRTLRSRQMRRRSFFLGAWWVDIAHTRGSPRLKANSARTSASPSNLSVFARRRLARDCYRRWIDDGNFLSRSPSAHDRSRSRQVRLPECSRSEHDCPYEIAPCLELRKTMQQCRYIAATTECFDIFSPFPGDNDVISQVERESSNDTNIAARSVADSGRRNAVGKLQLP